MLKFSGKKNRQKDVGVFELNTYRKLALAAAFLLPFFGIIYKYSHVDAFDPWWQRFFIACVSLAIYFGSFIKTYFKTHIKYFVYGLGYLITLWVIQLCYFNQFSIDYTIGLMLVFFCICMIFAEQKYLAVYVISTVIMSGLAVIIAPFPEVTEPLLISTQGTIGLIAYIVVSSRLQIQEDLLASEDLMTSIFNESADALFLINPQTGVTIDCNERAVSIFEADKKDRLLGININNLQEKAFDREEILEILKLLQNRGGWNQELVYITLKGKKFWGDLAIREIPVFGKKQWLARVSDITARKEAEAYVRRLNVELEHRVNERTAELKRSNEELQQFAYVASHDLQEPLRKIQAFSDRLIAKHSFHLSDQAKDYLHRMQNAAQRMQKMINDLLTLSRVATKAQPFIQLDLNELVRDVISDLEFRIEQTGGTIKVDKLPVIEADPVQMHLLFLNLIGNALKFHREGVQPVIHIYNSSEKTDAALHHNGGNMCQIVVEDNGIGFDEKYLDRIFTIFQRLHGRTIYEGTGIGLAICRKIVERHGGKILAKSKPGEGAKFVVILPEKQKQKEGIDNVFQETSNNSDGG